MKLSDLAGRPLTYAEVGATAAGLPAGYHHVRLSSCIGRGRARFERAADSVMRYGMLRGAGLRVAATTEVAEVGTDVLGRLGPFAAPCRVVYVVDETNRRGFAYGSLPGHAVSGEEMFGVRFNPSDESVHAEVVAFSTPATWWSQVGAPVAALVQRVITRRYLSVV
ncbi:DUF1990 domain-containing protein [Mycolicibacterium rhodesiae]|uniref:DUF1990 domain-containing protein n=1 Tax=Mycolicibacterium rhodesiae TaxID=36814 RepID=A0A1X0J6L9_MYCRH|nr:DUF1990 domain-containing protein [Mycolicibacterium rhodesiae]MCV7348235.1 DUF1990 domain-containing protein [Mycolicibacterium rhodesiae]ORB57416.1 hypothetical protein BST42_03360 [Mycolicibacterium rhodesiae]